MSAEKAILVFIPLPVMSHLVATVKTAKLIAHRDHRLSVTVIVMKLPHTDINITSFTKNPAYSCINFVQLPENKTLLQELMKSPKTMMPRLIESQKGPVKDVIAEIMESQKATRLAGFVVDIFCTTMIDLAKELGAPAYLFFTCGAASLGIIFHLQSMHDDDHQDLSEYENSGAEISIPTYFNPVPARVWPSAVFEKDGPFIHLARKLREANGIVVNTFLEFESHAIKSLSADKKIPSIYPVGPIIKDEGEETDEAKQKRKEILGWLDEQPDKSVVFLCFGTNGHFSEDQVKEIAAALEKSGHRFLWSLRKPPPKDKMGTPGEYENPGEVLPEGFLERTAGIGKIIGWAPQMAVLSHPSIGGFVSHCGWNSTLESVWFGVPMAVWPMEAEQQANAFQLVKDFGMAVEIKMDYRKNSKVVVPGIKIEKAIRELMDQESGIRVKVSELQEESRKVLTKGESSYDYLGRLIDNLF